MGDRILLPIYQRYDSDFGFLEVFIVKTTVDIATSLFHEVKRQAAQKGITLRELIEGALRSYLRRQEQAKGPFRLKKNTFKGKGLVEGLSEGDGAAIRDRAYEGRGS
jgi:hypothetical protein